LEKEKNHKKEIQAIDRNERKERGKKGGEGTVEIRDFCFVNT